MGRGGVRDGAPRDGAAIRFGFVDGWHKVGRKFWPGVQAAAYLSSYFAGGRGRARGKMVITQETVLDGGLPRGICWSRSDPADRMHDADPPERASAMGQQARTTDKRG